MKSYLFGAAALVLVILWLVKHSTLFVSGDVLLVGMVFAYLAGLFTPTRD